MSPNLSSAAVVIGALRVKMVFRLNEMKDNINILHTQTLYKPNSLSYAVSCKLCVFICLATVLSNL